MTTKASLTADQRMAASLTLTTTIRPFPEAPE